MSTYQVGGSLRLEAPYVLRSADDELYQNLMNGQFCYVFNCRQMGKSSLRVRTAERLRQSNVTCLTIDLSTIGASTLTARQWYASIIKTLHHGLGQPQDLDLKTWLNTLPDASPTQLLFSYIDDILLPWLDAACLVIFLDEIDCIRGLAFDGSDFFALIRACYNRRADDARYEHLNFVLLGVATPSGLITDPHNTPFNIGTGIELTGLKFESAGVLAAGLQEVAHNPMSVLDAVLRWTGGQPFLTQKLCQLLQIELTSPIVMGEESSMVANFVHQHLIDQWQFNDEPIHFKTIESRIKADESRSAKLLGLYQKILQQGGIRWDGSPEHQDLRLTGLVVRQGQQLQVYNPIYQKIFSQQWVNESLETLRPVYYQEKFNRWQTDKKTEWLLRGEELTQALLWSERVSLTGLDNEYLKASQSQDKQLLIDAYMDIKQNLTDARQEEIAARHKIDRALSQIKALESRSQQLQMQQEDAKSQISRANQKRDESIQNYKTSQKLAMMTLALTLFLLVISVGLVFQVLASREQRRIILQGNTLERHAMVARHQSSKLRGLLQALKLGLQLKSLIPEDASLSQYPARQPIYTLAELKREIHEKNQYRGHRKSVNWSTFSPDGASILTASSDRTLRLWDLSGKLLQQYAADAQVVMVDFHPSGKVFIATTEGMSAQVWSLNGQRQITLSHQARVTQAVFSPDGNRILTASIDGTVRLWDLGGYEMKQFATHSQPLSSISFSPDGTHLLTTSTDGTARVWSLDGEEIHRFDEQGVAIRHAAFHPDGDRIVTALVDGTATVWGLEEEKRLSINGHSSAVNAVSFGADGKSIITASNDSTVKIWDEAGKELQVLTGHSGFVRDIDVSPNGQMLLTASDDRTARLWHLNGQWDLKIQGHAGLIKSIDYDSTNDWILSASTDGKAHIWNVKGQKQFTSFEHQRVIHHASFSSNGKYVLTASEDKTAKLWEIKGGTDAIQTFRGHERILRSAVFSPDDQLILTSSNDRTARLWTLSGVPLVRLAGHSKPVRMANFNYFGDQIVTASEDGTAKVWDLKGHEVMSFRGHADWVTSAVFSPDNQFILTASFDATARLWSVDGRLLHVFKGHAGRLTNAVFSPDGHLILTTSFDGTARLWDRAGNTVQVFQAPRGRISSANFSADGQSVIVGTHLGRVYAWKIETLPSLLSWGCAWMQDYIQHSIAVAPSERQMCHAVLHRESE